jgi:hypothetical protein
MESAFSAFGKRGKWKQARTHRSNGDGNFSSSSRGNFSSFLIAFKKD